MDALSADEPLIHPDCEIVETRFGGWCEVGRGARIVASTFGAFAYCDRYSDIANTDVGAFASIPAFTRIGLTITQWRRRRSITLSIVRRDTGTMPQMTLRFSPAGARAAPRWDPMYGSAMPP